MWDVSKLPQEQAVMCGRYNIIDDPFTQALMADLGLTASLSTRYNIAPTEQVPVVYELNGKRQYREMRWWLVPAWSDGPNTRYAMFNARAESVATSRTFRGPFARQRAILPASSFIEWQKQGGDKIPYDIKVQAGAIAFAGIWDVWQKEGAEIFSCSIITTEAVPQFSHIHQRMPLILHKTDYDNWLNPSQNVETLLPTVIPLKQATLELTPVSTRINNARNKEAVEAVGVAEIVTLG